MKKIGFKNFRRFTDFPDLEYGPITFLVGRNNAGKSTLVKALLLLDNYLKSSDVSVFPFGNKILEDVNIVTYGRAKNKLNKNDDYIKFNYQLEEFLIELTVSGKENETSVQVLSFIIKDLNESFTYSFEGSTITISKEPIYTGDQNNNNALANIEIEIKALKTTIEASRLKKSSKGYLELIDQLNNLIKRRNLLVNKGKEIIDETSNEEIIDNQIEETKSKYEISVSFERSLSRKDVINSILPEIETMYDMKRKAIDDGEPEAEDFPDLRGFYQDRNKIDKSFKRFEKIAMDSKFIYLGANSFKQSSLFSIRDINNPLSQAIHEFKQLGIDKRKASTAYVFAKKWMQEDKFEIGEDFEINMYAGEAYEVLIKSHNVTIPLADKGMGSVQAMLLILRLACIIDKYSEKEITVTVVVEEPELNLHPALQSKLAELLLDVNQNKKLKCKIHFIIETHSEYLIRKTQLLVKENEFEVKPNENPFCVIYFDKNLKQWKMNYRQDGKFIEEFGSGFFDETRNIVKKMM